jgi:regulator of protease activity HflC (stomatin/prohibitin superfamily)
MKKFLVLLTALLSFALLFTGCSSVEEISPSQTAFLIPVTGDTTQQGKFDSENFLKKNKVAGKRVYVYSQWEGFQHGWMPTAKLIIVERKPVTREWTESEKTGTSNKDDGITAESKESIGFMARMNCSSQIDEVDAVKFLYRYNNQTLENIMDREVRAKIESKFVEECAKLTLDDILIKKSEILTNIKNDIIPYFKERGITITTFGLKGEFTYLNKEIQASIDKKFKSAQDAIAQKNINEQVISKSKADAEAINIQSQSIEKSLKLKELENQSKAIDKWDGKMPQVAGGSNSILNIPIK